MTGSQLLRWSALGMGSTIWVLAATRVLVDPTPRVPLLFNWTPSLPYSVAWLSRRSTEPPARGDHVLYRFEGPATSRYPGLTKQPFFKIVRGLPGDRITVVDRRVYVNGRFVGEAKRYAFDRQPLAPIEPGAIPERHFYVQGTSVDSFDSRYASSGLVRFDQVIGKVTPLL